MGVMIVVVGVAIFVVMVTATFWGEITPIFDWDPEPDPEEARLHDPTSGSIGGGPDDYP